MLHEILLSLSGQPSPLFEQCSGEGGHAEGGFPLLSAPEKALLGPLAHLSELHRKLRTSTLEISSSHPSTICRAAATAITTKHLGNFQQKILEVEKAILATDAGYVGGYGIVPLSTIVGEFKPWVRRLEWLWDITRTMNCPSSTKEDSNVCTGNKLIDHLRRESQTGYLDLEEMAMDLVKAAEIAWMRQLSMWILYGQLPLGGQVDFFIQEHSPRASSNQLQNPGEFSIRADLLPSFVSAPTAHSILFVGKSLNHIRSRGTLSPGAEPKESDSSHTSLHGDYIRRLSSLSSPITAVGLSSAVAEIRMSLSQTVLSRLLPLPKIIEVLSVLHEFLLLQRGEFAMALVSFAEKRLHAKSQAHGSNKPKDNLEGLTVKQGEVALVLVQAWSELYSLQNEEDPIDDCLDLAREVVHLSIKGSKDDQASADKVPDSNALTDISNVAFDDLLFSTPTSLSLRIRSPLDLFLSQSDMAIYSKIHAYLLGIRRAQIRLSDLWKLTSLRRTYPAPWGPPLSNKRGGQERLRSTRQREKFRTTSMRAIWASARASLFVLSELGSYLQGQVIHDSWNHFRQWLEGGRQRPSSSSSSRPATASSAKTKEDPSSEKHEPHDPETVTVAHRIYLTHLSHSLFLTHTTFTQSLRDLLTKVDHFIALIIRLQSVQHNLDLETDEGVVDTLADYAADERNVWAQLRQARTELDRGVVELVARLRDIDEARLMEGYRPFDLGVNNGAKSSGSGFGGQEEDRFGQRTNEYVPCRTAGVDRLLMSLEFVGAPTSEEGAGYEFGSLVRAE